MISGNVVQGFVQHGDQIFQVLIRQITAADDKFDILKMAAGNQPIDTVNNLVAYSQDFHNAFILPYNQFLGKSLSDKIVISLLFAIPPTAHYNSLIQLAWNF